MLSSLPCYLLFAVLLSLHLVTFLIFSVTCDTFTLCVHNHKWKQQLKQAKFLVHIYVFQYEIASAMFILVLT